MGLKLKAPIKEATKTEVKASINKGLSVPKTEPKEDLKAKASENTTVVKKKGKEPEEVIKQGANKDHAPKHNILQGVAPLKSPRTAGISFGLTLNMGDYESLRVDCWLTDTVGENESQEEALVRLGDIVQKQTEYEVNRIKGN